MAKRSGGKKWFREKGCSAISNGDFLPFYFLPSFWLRPKAALVNRDSKAIAENTPTALLFGHS